MPRAAGPLTPERWERAKQLLEEALERPHAARRVFLGSLGHDTAALAVSGRKTK
jgi:hypothetical protein